VTERKPTKKEAQRTDKVRIVYTAHLIDVIWFSPPLTISVKTKEGRANRASLGIVDVNLLGWSQSMSSINLETYNLILAQCEIDGHIHGDTPTKDFSIPDSWSKTRTRRRLRGFTDPVLSRSNGCCIVCGTSASGLVDAAHISPYATDFKNRANPANGICLCKYCHAAFDQRTIAVSLDGTLKVSRLINQDSVASFHFTQVTKEKRRKWIEGVDIHFLSMTISWFDEKEAQLVVTADTDKPRR